jgi:hypothetical protein
MGKTEQKPNKIFFLGITGKTEQKIGKIEEKKFFNLKIFILSLLNKSKQNT